MLHSPRDHQELAAEHLDRLVLPEFVARGAAEQEDYFAALMIVPGDAMRPVAIGDPNVGHQRQVNIPPQGPEIVAKGLEVLFHQAGTRSRSRRLFKKALLGIYRSTNVNVRGLAVLGSYVDIKGSGSSSGNCKGILLSWTGDNAGPWLTAGQGGALSGFGLQRATSLSGPWTTTYADGNSATVTDTGSMAFYRIAGPINGMSTLFAPAVTLP